MGRTKVSSNNDSYLSSKSEQDRVARRVKCLEPVNLDICKYELNDDRSFGKGCSP